MNEHRVYHIWIDESGDDGVRQGSSPYLILGGLLVEDPYVGKARREVEGLIQEHCGLLKGRPLHLAPILARRRPYRHYPPYSMVRFLGRAGDLLGTWKEETYLGIQAFVFAMKKSSQKGVAANPVWFHAFVLRELLSAIPGTGAVQLYVDNEARRQRFLQAQAILRRDGYVLSPRGFQIEVVNIKVVNWRHDVLMQMADLVATLGYLDATFEEGRDRASIRTLNAGLKVWKKRALRGLEETEPPKSVRAMLRRWLERMGVRVHHVMMADGVKAGTVLSTV